MSDTPRTDKEAFMDQVYGEIVEADFSRKLERELNVSFIIIEKAAATLDDFANAEAALGRHMMANAAAIARDATREAAKALGK